jgi:hypothetical protein
MVSAALEDGRKFNDLAAVQDFRSTFGGELRVSILFKVFRNPKSEWQQRRTSI